MQPKPALRCPLCGGPNDCAPAACGSFDLPCWCREARIDPAVPARIPPAQRGQTCVCPRCAAGEMPPAKAEDLRR
ncbi:cysteine-rich CWC family protein [Chitinimonas sp.]|uniref:cysteine-rich CWC family protein n=1 Tax=Chitinimonas sp. TaxID=1934313 RepID=UPI002F931D85